MNDKGLNEHKNYDELNEHDKRGGLDGHNEYKENPGNPENPAPDRALSTVGASQTVCSSCCEHCRHKERSEKEYKDLITRLNRIEGQIRGIKGMVDGSAYCLDILTQVSAATSALNSFSKALLQSHIKSCVANDIREGNNEKLDELIQYLPKMMK